MGAPKASKGKWAPKGKGKGKAPAKGKGKGKDYAAPASGKGKGKAGVWKEAKPRVLVTGASGYVAGHVVTSLLRKGYKVRGTVRSLESDNAKALKRLFPALELVEADLLGGAEAFEKAMDGVKYVMHTASPFQMSCEDPQKDFVDPAVKGTEAVMQAAGKAGVERVVVTSSVAAVGPPQPWMADPSTADKEKVFTEEDWNTTSSLEAGPYRLSKRLAEEKANEIAATIDGLTVSVVCPSFVIGPMLTSRVDAVSVQWMKSMLDGTMKEKGCSGGTALGVVDVRDLAIAHVAAMETPEAAGKRFLCTSEIGQGHLEMVDMIRDRFKAYPLPTEGQEVVYKVKYSNERAKEELKVKFRPVDVSLRDMANAAVRNGIVPRKYVLKATKFSTVDKIAPDSKGVNLLVKVVSVEDKVAVVGDDTGIVKVSLSDGEAEVAVKDKVVEIRNAVVRMDGGYIQLFVGKWGKISTHEGDSTPTPKEDKNISSVEYELVN